MYGALRNVFSRARWPDGGGPGGGHNTRPSPASVRHHLCHVAVPHTNTNVHSQRVSSPLASFSRTVTDGLSPRCLWSDACFSPIQMDDRQTCPKVPKAPNLTNVC